MSLQFRKPMGTMTFMPALLIDSRTKVPLKDIFIKDDGHSDIFLVGSLKAEALESEDTGSEDMGWNSSSATV